uniref:RING-type E3 ubiquitin transferase n=1 Tax=Kalanchoe fedtschenkoi TaxID=63787 RepID=A0A7N0RDR9_KALFE
MESPKPVGEDTVVAIAVDKGKVSQAAFKWAAENLLAGGRSVSLVHVIPKAMPFEGMRSHMIGIAGGQDLQKSVHGGYKEILELRARENLRAFESYCKKKNIQSELVILEDNDMVKAIADYVLTNQVDVLVVGAGSQNGILKKFKGPDVASRVAKSTPYFCSVYIIANGRLHSVRCASSTEQALSDNEVSVLEHEESILEPRLSGQLTDSGSPGSSVTALLRPDLDKEFEFRSPLQNHGHLDFSFGGLSASDLDISFITPDRQFYDSSSSSHSANTSDWSLGSFGSSNPSSNITNRGVGSQGSLHPDSACDPMDESQRLRLELIKIKQMYESVDNEAPDANGPGPISRFVTGEFRSFGAR